MTHTDLSKHHNLPTSLVEISVAFHDIDSMGVVWHGNYMKYFEIARCAVLQEIDYDFPQMKNSGYTWPIVDIRSRFVSPVRYGDKLEVIAIIAEWHMRLLIKYLIINKTSQQVMTRGQSVQVPLDMKTMTMAFGCPDLLQEKIDVWQKSCNPKQ